jgi:hypothetical protein
VTDENPPTPEQAIEFLALPDTEEDMSSFGPVDLPWDILPSEFLDFADAEVAEGGREGLVNAMSNSKRALHGQVDSILYSFGLKGQLQANFPRKMDLMSDLGVVTRQAFSRLNESRHAPWHTGRSSLCSPRAACELRRRSAFVG